MSVGTDKLASPGALRMALALAVFLHHTTMFNLGMSAVLIFFVLSGYWVAAMWANTYSKTSLSYATFLVSRVWRIVPVFALCSAIAWTLLFWRGATPEDAGGIIRQLFSNVMILGYNSLPFQANIPGWSLDMEMQFYLIAPIFVFLVARNLYVLVACVGLSILSKGLGGAATVAPFLLFFGLGVAAASHKMLPSRALAYRSLYAALALLLACALIFAANLALGGTQGALLAFGPKTNLLIALLMTPWAIYTTQQKTGALDRMVGDMSYIVYLLHWTVIGALHTGEGGYIERLILCSEALALILVASYAIWALFDRPIGKLRSAWVANRRVDRAPIFAAAVA
ncbi:acyltransferase family protein [Methylocystis parvus]|uniref:Acyltransferase n=1 Tax=Methylocystis parvus TaxID=134 RepID=A0A6B8M0C9_9HYPH|nr:acyltransferase [Methylocystis parvus]QGM96291.1 acyltransferase [Methylocystis parvus]WBJ99872.1 acyltransferase [Methylocystis parvus OBBP]